MRLARRTSMPAKQTITSIKALPGKEIAKGVRIKPLAGDHVMLNYVEFVPAATVPAHSHHHEQLGLIIEGELEMEIGSERRTLRPGDTYVIPGGIRHSVRRSLPISISSSPSMIN